MDPPAVTITVLPAPVVVPALVSPVVVTFSGTARALAGTAHGGGSEGARQLCSSIFCPLRPAAGLKAVLFPPTVALLPLLHNSIATDGDLRSSKTSLWSPGLGSKYLVNTPKAARRELLVVVPVPGGGPSVHDVVSVVSARYTILISLWVVGGSKVVSHLMSHRHVGHSRGDRLAVVHQSNDAGVETLVATTVVLSKKMLFLIIFNRLSLSPRASHRHHRHS